MNDDELQDLYAPFASALRPPPNAVGRVRDAIAARRRRQLGAASGVTVAALVGGAVVAAGISRSGDRDTTPPVVNPTTPTSTSTSPPGHRPSYAELHVIDEWKWETSFGQYRKDLLALAQSYDNYTGYRLVFTSRSRSFLVYGAGDPPPAVTTMISEGPMRAHTRWVSRPYSYRQLQQAISALFRALPRAGSGNVRRDYTGVVIGMFATSLSPADRARLQTIARTVTDVPVTFTAGGGAVPLAGGLR